MDRKLSCELKRKKQSQVKAVSNVTKIWCKRKMLLLFFFRGFLIQDKNHSWEKHQQITKTFLHGGRWWLCGGIVWRCGSTGSDGADSCNRGVRARARGWRRHESGRRYHLIASLCFAAISYAMLELGASLVFNLLTRGVVAETWPSVATSCTNQSSVHQLGCHCIATKQK